MEEVPDHAHCKVCGKAVPRGDITCGKVCAAKRADTIRRRQTLTYIFYGVGILLLILLLYSVHL